MKLFIAEKPSVAKCIVNFLDSKRKRAAIMLQRMAI